MLLQIRDYLKKVSIASNQQIARQFGLDTSALQPMLDLWCAKGVIGLCNTDSPCKSRCVKCPSKTTTLAYYQVLG